MLYVYFPLSVRNVEDLLHERGIDVSHETIRFWWNRFGPMFASEIAFSNSVSAMASLWRVGRTPCENKLLAILPLQINSSQTPKRAA